MAERVYQPYYVLPQGSAQPVASTSSSTLNNHATSSTHNQPGPSVHPLLAASKPNPAFTEFKITQYAPPAPKPKKPTKPKSRKKPLSSVFVPEIHYEYNYPPTGDFQFSHELYTCLRRVFHESSVCPAISETAVSRLYSFSIVCHPNDTIDSMLHIIKGQLEVSSGWKWIADLGRKEDDDKKGVAWAFVGRCRGDSSTPVQPATRNGPEEEMDEDRSRCEKHAVKFSVRLDSSHPFGFPGLRVTVFVTPFFPRLQNQGSSVAKPMVVD